MVCHVLLLSNGAVPRLSRQGEVRLFSKIRNEKLRLPAFLRHYRSLGVDRFFIVDNDSTDGSTEYLLAQPDVHLFGLVPAFEKQGGALTGSTPFCASSGLVHGALPWMWTNCSPIREASRRTCAS